MREPNTRSSHPDVCRPAAVPASPAESQLEYLKLRRLEQSAPAKAAAPQAAAPSGLQGAELRAARKEVAALERRIAKLAEQAGKARTALADHDQSDYAGLGREMEAIAALEAEIAAAEERWFELADEIG